MAIIKCPECGQDISTEAKSCPCCGAENKEMTKKAEETKNELIYTWVMFGVAAILGIVWIITKNTTAGCISLGFLIGLIIRRTMKKKK